MENPYFRPGHILSHASSGRTKCGKINRPVFIYQIIGTEKTRTCYRKSRNETYAVSFYSSYYDVLAKWLPIDFSHYIEVVKTNTRKSF